MRFVVGLDLGQSQDYSALGVVEKPAEPEAPLAVRDLFRWPLGTSYVQIAKDVAGRLATPQLAGHEVTLVVDKTGVGAAVVDVLRAAGLRPITITITGGNAVHYDGYADISVPKREIVSAMQASLQTGHLKVAASLPHAETLVAELANFKVTLSAAGHDSYGAAADWRDGNHDDLLLAVGMAVWHARYGRVRGAWFAV